MIIVPVILAGGVGERFWPFSSSKRPKQLLPIISNRPMIEETFKRISSFSTKGIKPLLVTGKSMATMIRKILPATIKYDCIAEPIGKNTAPAVAIAAAWIKAKYGEDAVMVVLSADHSIQNKRAFVNAVRYAALQAATRDALVVFGITPSRPDTGYGYIQFTKKLEEGIGGDCFSVKRFVEKPTQKKAVGYIKTGKYLWNSGMFVWRTKVILEEFERSMPTLHKQVCIVLKEKFTKKSINTFYKNCVKESIDFGIMEHAQNVVAVAGTFVWDDIGSWEALLRIHPKDSLGTVSHGKHIITKDCSNTIIANNSKHTVGVFGLDNTVVAVVDGAVLVISRDKLPEFKKYLALLKEDPKTPKNLF